MLGFIRYHFENDKILINTIQTDISSIVFYQESEKSIESINFYKFLCTLIMQYFIKQQHKKGITQIIIPSSNLRTLAFRTEGMPSIYDDLPKKMGFDKIEFKNTIWYKKIIDYKYNSFYNLTLMKDSNAWVLNGLNENFNNHI
jgi:hypothetical protein